MGDPRRETAWLRASTHVLALSAVMEKPDGMPGYPSQDLGVVEPAPGTNRWLPAREKSCPASSRLQR
jgi:hypothetical protein